MLFSACAGDVPDSGDGDKTSADISVELQEGVITYEDATCESIKGVEDSGTVATAVASNGAPVKYTLDEENEENLNSAFGGALSIAEDGTIKGSYASTKKRKIYITASAEKCESVTAEITISVVNPYLDYKGRQLIDARNGVQYSASVAYITPGDVIATYSLPSGSKLPQGLSLSSSGIIYGTPTEVGRGVPFTVRASASGYSATDAEFVIDVVIDHKSETPSNVINFGKEGETVKLESVIKGEYYLNQSGVAGNASALNGNAISYELAENSELPEGLTLYSNGAIFGVCDELYEETPFTVIASADHCESVMRTFSIEVKPKGVKYENIKGVITKGEATEFDIAKATIEGSDVAISYSVSETEAAMLLSDYGLTVTEDGKVTGTPKKTEKTLTFSVTASAEGSSPTTAVIYLTINEPLQAPENGRFEAEYVDLTGKQGTGYSGSPSDVAMIDSPPQGVSASKGKFVNFMHNDTITLEFVIYAENDVDNAGLYAGLGSEFGNVTFTPSSLGVYTYVGQTAEGTKTTVNYGSINVKGDAALYNSFDEYQLGTVSLVKGWNVIQIAVLTNELRGGFIGGPGVDYIRVDTSVSLKWVPLLYNVGL